MKIIILATTAESTFAFRAELVQKLKDIQHQVFVFAVDYTAASRKRIAELGGTPVDYHLDRTGMNPFRDLYNTFRLAKILKSIGPDMIICYCAKPVIYGAFAAVLARVKRRVGVLEGLGYVFTDDPKGTPIKVRILRGIQIFLYRVSFPLLEKIIFLNPDDPIDLVEKHHLRVNCMEVLGGIGLNLEKYPYVKPKSQGDIVFLFVGRLLKEKGIYEFIEAAKIVRTQAGNTKFLIIGGVDDSNPGSLTSMEIDTFCKQGLVEYRGFVSNVGQVIAESSVFVLPSYYREGVPRSTQEALAIGRPIITTDVPGCRETVRENTNGFLVTPGNRQELAEKMLFYVKNPNEIVSQGIQSYMLAKEKYNVHEVNNRFIAMLRIECLVK